ncbi:MAG: hypothetical protein ACI8X5_003106 [Planctomycetota bacterium]|jgi:hypothetical protein
MRSRIQSARHALVFTCVSAIATTGASQQLGVGDPPVQWPGNGHWYSVVPGDWNEAQAAAKSICASADLVSINSQAEQDWIVSTFGPFGTTPGSFDPTRRWIGLTDEGQEGSWMWVSSDPYSYSTWWPGEPNGGTLSNHVYLGRYSNGQWNDGPLVNAAFGIAEWSASDCSLLGTATCLCSNDSSPCGNLFPVAGCMNSTQLGATLTPLGSGSVATDDLSLNATQLPSGVMGIFFGSSTTVTPLSFGDGLRCVGGGIVRFSAPMGSSPAGDLSAGPGLASNFGLQPFSIWNFQCWYRDPSGPCGSGFNTSNGYQVTFMP